MAAPDEPLAAPSQPYVAAPPTMDEQLPPQQGGLPVFNDNAPGGPPPFNPDLNEQPTMPLPPAKKSNAGTVAAVIIGILAAAAIAGAAAWYFLRDKDSGKKTIDTPTAISVVSSTPAEASAASKAESSTASSAAASKASSAETVKEQQKTDIPDIDKPAEPVTKQNNATVPDIRRQNNRYNNYNYNKYDDYDEGDGYDEYYYEDDDENYYYNGHGTPPNIPRRY